ncbi:hypothetical protein PIROE2DRAFT_7306 [Piromyces sp. E2]|nr:hypothetical protein PIROE2DRAFT_7306 [Piromyces sp. E2]|eukprot:OUM65639.1 hypothetical protein PIROE2DRAFT_7306 [Piromyces sp. E2]
MENQINIKKNNEIKIDDNNNSVIEVSFNDLKKEIEEIENDVINNVIKDNSLNDIKKDNKEIKNDEINNKKINDLEKEKENIDIQDFTTNGRYVNSFSKLTSLQELMDIFKGPPAFTKFDIINNLQSYNGKNFLGSAYTDKNNMKNPKFNVKNLSFRQGFLCLHRPYEQIKCLDSFEAFKKEYYENIDFDEIGINDIEICSLEEVNEAMKTNSKIFSNINVRDLSCSDIVCLNLSVLNESALRYLKVFSTHIIDLSNRYKSKIISSAITKPMEPSNAVVLDNTLHYQDIEFGLFFCLDYLHWGEAQANSILEIPCYNPIEGVINYLCDKKSYHYLQYVNNNKADVFQYFRILKTYCMQQTLAKNHYMATVNGNYTTKEYGNYNEMTLKLIQRSFINNVSYVSYFNKQFNYQDAPTWIPYELPLYYKDQLFDIDDNEHLQITQNFNVIKTNCKYPRSFYPNEKSYTYITRYDKGPTIHLNHDYVHAIPDTIPYYCNEKNMVNSPLIPAENENKSMEDDDSNKIHLQDYTNRVSYKKSFSKVSSLQEVMDKFKFPYDQYGNIHSYKIRDVYSVNGLELPFGKAYQDKNNMENPKFNVKNLKFMEYSSFRIQRPLNHINILKEFESFKEKYVINNEPYYDNRDHWSNEDAYIESLYHYMPILMEYSYSTDVRTPSIRLIKNWLYDEITTEGTNDIEIRSLEEVNQAMKTNSNIFSNINASNISYSDIVCLNLSGLNESALRYLKVFSTHIIDLSNQYKNKIVSSTITKPMEYTNAVVLDNTLLFQDIEFGLFLCLDYLHWGEAQSDTILEIPPYNPIEGIISYYCQRHYYKYSYGDFLQNVYHYKANVFQYFRILKTYCMQQTLAEDCYMATVNGKCIETNILTNHSFINNATGNMLANDQDAPAWIPYELISLYHSEIQLDDNEHLKLCSNGKVIKSNCHYPRSFSPQETSYTYSTQNGAQGPTIRINHDYINSIPDTVHYYLDQKNQTAGILMNSDHYFINYSDFLNDISTFNRI